MAKKKTVKKTKKKVSGKKETEEKKEEKESSTVVPLSTSHKGLLWIITVVLVVAVGIYFFGQLYQPTPYDSVEYNGFNFVLIDGSWYTQWQRNASHSYTLSLHFNPYEVEQVPVSGKLDSRFDKRDIFVTFDPDPATTNLTIVALAVGELSLNLARGLELNPIGACTFQDNDGCIGRPIVTCDNTNHSVIYVKQDPVTALRFEGNCMIIQGEGLELVRAVDRVLYQWYRIYES